MLTRKMFLFLLCCVLGFALGFVAGKSVGGIASIQTAQQSGTPPAMSPRANDDQNLELAIPPVAPDLAQSDDSGSVKEKKLSGFIKSIAGDNLVMRVMSIDLLHPTTSDEQKIAIKSDTKISLLVPKNQEDFEKELQAFQKEEASRSTPTLDPSSRPQMLAETAADRSALEVGQTINVTLDADNLSALSIVIAPSPPTVSPLPAPDKQ